MKYKVLLMSLSSGLTAKTKMKHLFYTFLFIAISFSVNAQTERGRWMVGGDISSNAQKTTQKDFGETYKSTFAKITWTPRAGYFVQDNLMVGLALGISTDKYKDIDNGYSYTVKDIDTELKPFVRYYLPLASGFFFGEANALLGSINEEGDKTSRLGFGVGPGYTFFVGEKIAVELLGKYTLGNYSYTDDNITEKLSFKKISLSVGLNYYF